MKLTLIRSLIKDLVEGATEKEVFIDVAPTGVTSGYVLTISTIENTYLHPEDAKPDKLDITADILAFSFDNRNESDTLIDTVTEALDGKCSDDFLRIKNDSVSSMDYNDELGVFVSIANFTFSLRGNINGS